MMKTDNKRRKILKPYAVIRLLQDSGNNFLFNKRKFKVLDSVGLSADKLYPVKFVFDTVAGTNLIREDSLQVE